MIMSQTFYTDIKIVAGSSENKWYLQAEVQKHAFWKNKEFWERAIKEGIIEEAQGIEGKTVSEEEKVDTVNQIVFGKLGTFAYNMMHFGLDKPIVEERIFAIAKEKNLPTPFIHALKVLINCTSRYFFSKQ